MKFDEDNKRTEYDFICEYSHEIVSSALVEYYSMYSADGKADDEIRTAYVNAVMKARLSDLPHVEGWEYIPDVRTLIPARKDGSEEFLLNNSELCAVGSHFNRKLRTDHWYDKYQFEKSIIAEWYSWLPMCAVFYDDDTMDLITAT